jgi:hypothetical protein
VLLDGNIARTVALKHDGGHYGDVIEFLDSLEVVDGRAAIRGLPPARPAGMEAAQ